MSGIWDNKSLSSFERYPKITELVKNVGDKVELVGCDDGSEVPADRIAARYKDTGQKGIKAKDSNVFVVEHEGKQYELWLGATNWTALRQLKEIRDNNGDTLLKAKFTIEKVSENDPEKSTYEFKAV